MTVVAQHHPEPFVPAALERAGVPYEIRRTGSARVAERNLREVAGGGRVALCLVDRFRLPWHDGMPFGDAYEIAVTGVEGEHVLVDDEGPRPEQVAVEVLMAAWGGHRKGRHRLIAVTGRPDDLDLPAAIRDAVTTTYRHLTGPVLGHAFDVNFGLSGMRKLAAQLGDPRKGWRARFATPEKLVSALTRLRLCLEEEYGAPGAMRPLYAGFLDEAAPLVSPGLAEAAGLYREAGGCWSALAAAADSLAEDVVRGDPPDGLDELASLAGRAVAVEERAAEALQRSGAVRASVD